MSRTINGLVYDHQWWQAIKAAASDDGLDPDTARWGWKRVDGALVSSRGFRWPTAGWAEETSNIDSHNTGGCPKRPGDGLTVATVWHDGLRHGPSHGATVLLVAADPGDVLGQDDGKFRAARVWVAAPFDLYGLLREAPYANLTDANLTGAYLSGADLRHAYLSGAYLSGAYLTYADLTDADLTDADLTDANLTDANLTDANLTGANLSGVNLRHAYLSGADLTYAYLSGADLTDADLRHAYLSGANLTGADLGYAYLSGADLSGAVTDRWTVLPDGVDLPTADKDGSET